MVNALITQRTLYNFTRRVLLLSTMLKSPRTSLQDLLTIYARSARSGKVVLMLMETWLMMTVMKAVYMNYEHDIDLKSFISASLLSYSLCRDRHCNA